ncbi:MAG TPA: translesion DNA synthesis-associated protein ImuA [Burkholderiaceae bacterium]|nr:translesion DNA synthesis-associated protein ImuA [Burkholderiaceae bacterium]
MAAVLEWAGDDEEPVPASFPSSQHRTRGRRTPARPGELPPDIEAAIWRADQLGSPVTSVISSGFAALDAELPGAGWPCHSLTEILQPQPTVAEWRLLAPAMRQVVAAGGHIVVVGPPKSPHLPGLKYAGLDERHLVWIQADAPAERLWVTEQLIKTNAAGLLVSWLPQARQEQIRRLQVCAQACDGPVFLCRPAAAEHEPSAAPLRIQLGFGLDWELHVHLLKRKGPTHEGHIALRSVPGGLESIITPRLRTPSRLIASRHVAEGQREDQPHVVGGTAPRQAPVRRVTAH